MAEKVTVGNVKKCPNCGANVGSMAAFCPECGHEFSNIDANRSVQRLSDQLAAINDKPIDGIFMDEDDRADYIEEERIRLMCQCIKTFPLPTTKEDLLEFISYAVPQSTSKSSVFGDAELKKAWKSKANEAIAKSKIVLQKDPDSLAIIEEYEKQLNPFRRLGLVEDKQRSPFSGLGSSSSSSSSGKEGKTGLSKITIIVIVWIAISMLYFLISSLLS